MSVPTAFMAVMAYIDLPFRDALLPAYERALGNEIDRMLAVIPTERLAIQWDCPCEVGITEGFGPPNTWTFEDVAAELGRMAALVPEGVELGYHLCYGDPPDAASGHGKHWLEPNDASAMVRLTNAMLEHISRPVEWVHMPGPSSAMTMRTSSRSATCAYRRTPSCISGSCISRTASRARNGGSRQPRGTRPDSASRPSAASVGCPATRSCRH